MPALARLAGWLRMLAAAALAIFSIGLAPGAWAQPLSTARLVGAQKPVDIASVGLYWIDSTGRATPEEVAVGSAGASWQPVPADSSFKMHRGQALWIRFETEPAGPMQVWMLELPYAPIDRVSLFTEVSPGAWSASSAGDRVRVSQRPLAHRHPLLPLTLSPSGRTLHLVRIESPHEFAAPLRLLRQDMLIEQDASQLLALGIYFGLLGLGLAVASVIGLSRRDPTLELFALKQLLLCLAAASLTGVASIYLWPEAPAWNDLSPTLFAYGVFATTAWLVATTVLGIPGVDRERKLLRAVAALGGLLALVAAWIEPSLRIKIVGSYAALATLMCVLLLVLAWRRGDRYAPWLALSLGPLLVASVFPVARGLGLDVSGTLVQYAVLLGTTIEVPLMLLVLLRRSQRRLLHEERLEMLDRVDAATGLVSMGLFLERGQQMIVRSQRFGHQGVVMMIDIANADRIERDYREHRPDELPLRVAARLLALSRDIDVVARLSELRFGMVVEGPLSPTEEAALGPRVVASCLMPFADKPEGWVAQVRVAYALVPLDGSDIEVLERRLAELLAAVPPDSRKAVFTLGNTGLPTGG